MEIKDLKSCIIYFQKTYQDGSFLFELKKYIQNSIWLTFEIGFENKIEKMEKGKLTLFLSPLHRPVLLSVLARYPRLGFGPLLRAGPSPPSAPAQLPAPRVPSLSLAPTGGATLSGSSPTLVTDPDSYTGVHVWLRYATPSVQ